MAAEVFTEMRIRLSEEESMGLGYRIGRGIMTEVDVDAIRQEVVENDFDILRLRVDDKEVYADEKLAKLGWPVDKAGKIIKYQYNLLGTEKPAYIYPGTEFITYDGSQEVDLRSIVMKGCVKDPIGYYRTQPLNELIGKEREVEYMADYYSKMFLTPERQLWMLYLDGKPVAFLANTVEDGILDTPLAVVLPEMRGKKLLHEIMTSRNLFGLKHGLKSITNGARVDNYASNHVFEKFGMDRVGVDQIYHVLPMFSK